jgi:hypothetical protein
MRYRTGPRAVTLFSSSDIAWTGESTHKKPLESLTMTMRVVNQILKSRTFDPSTTHRSSANCSGSVIGGRFGEYQKRAI